MSKILVVGLGPLCEKGVRSLGAQCLRTWSFAETLLKDGHTVRLVTCPMAGDPHDPENNRPALVRHIHDGVEYQAFTNSDFDFIHRTLAQVARSFAPDAIVGVSNLPAWVAARLPLTAPLWADLYGYQMVEKQGQAARIDNDKVLVEAWRKEAIVARRADKLSAVSLPQFNALHGELAAVGRLNQHTFRYTFVHHLPATYFPVFAEESVAETPPRLRGKTVPEDAFILLWSGGYNYWTDPDFLFRFVEKALAGDRRIHYVSTGGAVEGYNTRTYDRFRELIQNSPYRERYHLLGWLPAEEIPAIYREADLALNVDEPNYETLFGARTRLNNLMAAGVPVLTTFGSEISHRIKEAGCGLVCPPDDEDAMAEAVLTAALEPGRLKDLAIKARAYAREEWSPGKVLAPLRQWARKPLLAPDNMAKLREHPSAHDLLDHWTNELEETTAILEKHDILQMRADRGDLDVIRRKTWFRLLRSVFRW
ncbi:glycosyltransferase [bacterium]|nr:glycosyltransferase [bacterium]